MKSHRKERVASVIREVISRAIAHQLNDPRVDRLTTVTRVEMVGDLELARVYITVSGDETAERRTLQAIRHARGFLQRIVAGELVMRQSPRVEFEIDSSVKIARETMELIAENRRNHPELFDDPNATSDNQDTDEGDEVDDTVNGSGMREATSANGDLDEVGT